MTLDDAIACVYQHRGCGHPVLEAAGILMIEVQQLQDKLKLAEGRVVGEERCEGCREWHTADNMVMGDDAVWLCKQCSKAIIDEVKFPQGKVSDV